MVFSLAAITGRASHLAWLITGGLLWQCAGTALSQSLPAGLPLTRNFSTEDYRAGIQNWGMHQDPFGLLYVANNFGLLIFDGEEWTQISLQGTTRTRAVYVSEGQRVFVGGQGNFGYLEAATPDSIRFVSLKGRLPAAYRNFDEVWKIYLVGEEVIFCTFEYLFAFNGEQLRVIDPGTPLGFSFLVNGELFTSTPEKGLMKLEAGTLQAWPPGSALASMDVRGIVPFDREHLLVATRESGFFVVNNYSIRPWQPAFGKLLSQMQVNVLYRLSGGNFAAGTQNGGLLVFGQDGRLHHHLGKGQGLTNSTVHCLFEDGQGNLWAGLNNGIACIEINQPFTLINDNLQLPGTGYTAARYHGRLYLGTSNGLFAPAMAEAAGEEPGFEPVRGSGGQVYELQETGGQLMMAHHNGGFTINGFSAERLPGFEGAWKFLELPGTGKMLAGTYNGMALLERQGRQWVFRKYFSGFKESARKFEMDEQGHIWVSHGYKGVYRLIFDPAYDNLQEVRFYGQEKGFPSNLLINVFRVNGQLLFAAEQGIYRYHPEADLFAADEALSAHFGGSHVRELEEDLQGNVYFLTDEEAGVLRRQPYGKYSKETSSFSKVYRFMSDDLENITVLGPENVLINAREGFIRYNPAADRPPEKDFATLIRRVEWNGRPLFGGMFFSGSQQNLNENLQQAAPELPYGKNTLRLRYACTFYEGMEQNEYQFMLRGFDNGWSAWTRNTEKEYTSLPEGRYTFMVRSRNVYGNIGSTMQYSFVVRPPWYRTPLAWALYATVFLCTAGMLVATLERRHRKRQRRLQADAQATIEQKDTELKEVAAKSEEEITRLRNERLELELKHKNSELASTAMHLINKNEFMGSLKGGIKEIIRNTKPPAPTEKGLQKLVKDIDRNLSEDEVWDRFEWHFDQVHGDFIKKLKARFPDLTPAEVKLAAFLRMNMSTKEIAHLLNISVRGVEISRYRLRKKLPLERTDNLVEYMMMI